MFSRFILFTLASLSFSFPSISSDIINNNNLVNGSSSAWSQSLNYPDRLIVAEENNPTQASLSQESSRIAQNPVFADLQTAIGYRFGNVELLILALRHPAKDDGHTLSYRGNQRLEFYGDAVLEHLIRDMLWREFPFLNNGELRETCRMMVENATLACISTHLKLPHISKQLKLSPSELDPSSLNVRSKANFVEALIAAVHEDGGMEASRSFVYKFLGGENVPKKLRGIIKDHVARLDSLKATNQGHVPSREEFDQKYDDSIAFLGESVLSLVLKTYLCRNFLEADEGILTRKYFALSSGESIDALCRNMNMDVNADGMKKYLGHLYLHGGMEKASEYIMSHWGSKNAPQIMRKVMKNNTRNQSDLLAPEHRSSFLIGKRIPSHLREIRTAANNLDQSDQKATKPHVELMAKGNLQNVESGVLQNLPTTLKVAAAVSKEPVKAVPMITANNADSETDNVRKITPSDKIDDEINKIQNSIVETLTQIGEELLTQKSYEAAHKAFLYTLSHLSPNDPRCKHLEAQMRVASMFIAAAMNVTQGDTLLAQGNHEDAMEWSTRDMDKLDPQDHLSLADVHNIFAPVEEPVALIPMQPNTQEHVVDAPVSESLKKKAHNISRAQELKAKARVAAQKKSAAQRAADLASNAAIEKASDLAKKAAAQKADVLAKNTAAKSTAAAQKKSEAQSAADLARDAAIESTRDLAKKVDAQSTAANETTALLAKQVSAQSAAAAQRAAVIKQQKDAEFLSESIGILINKGDNLFKSRCFHESYEAYMEATEKILITDPRYYILEYKTHEAYKMIKAIGDIKLGQDFIALSHYNEASSLFQSALSYLNRNDPLYEQALRSIHTINMMRVRNSIKMGHEIFKAGKNELALDIYMDCLKQLEDAAFHDHSLHKEVIEAIDKTKKVIAYKEMPVVNKVLKWLGSVFK